VKRVLIISPHFPPINAPDLQRIRMSLPYYRANGWEPIVLCVDEREVDGVREPELAQTIPDDVKVIRSPALSLRWMRRLGVRNIGLRCWLHFLFAGARLIRRERIDLVFFSNTQFVTFTLGRVWRAWLGTPYVFDMQDPWRTDYYERAGSRRPPGGWKYQIARLMAWTLEGWSFRRVAGVVSVSPRYLSDLRARYPAFEHVPAAVIGFGASREDMVMARAIAAPVQRYPRDAGQIHLLYTGASGPVMPHALTVLFDGLRLYREKNPVQARRLRFHFFGTSYVAPGQGHYSVLPVAERCGVADQVDEVPHRLGHLECLRLQLEADVLVLPGSTDLAYSPSKIYPYFLADRPILAVVFQDSVLENLLHELSCAFVVTMTESGPKDEAHAVLARFFDLALAGFPAGSLPTRNRARFDAQFLAETLTRMQCRLFDQALDDSGAPA
jgi:hypothetical protein